MSDDLLITPGSRKLEIKDSSGNIDAKIETDASGNLQITNAGGDIAIGDTSSDVFIGDGTNNVDIVFAKTISTLFVPSPIKTSDDVSPIAISPPALVICKLPLASVSIFASIFPDESFISSFLEPGVISKSSDIYNLHIFYL